MPPHTAAKHRILKHYLLQWFPILGKYNKHLAYVDGFAGQGVYSKGEHGSPIIALNAANMYADNMSLDIDMWFIEKDRDRAMILKSQIENFSGRLSDHLHYKVINSEFEKEFPQIVETLTSDGSMPPTFAFIDPFGYSIKMTTLLDFLKNKKCEILVTFMSSKLSRFIDWENLSHNVTVDELFDDTSWRSLASNGKKKISALTELYVKRLKSNHVKYVKPFHMHNHSYPVYSLIFATNHPYGLNAMAGSMKNIGVDDDCQFFDANGPKQTGIYQYMDKTCLLKHPAELIFQKFSGTTTSVEKVMTFVNSNTDHVFDKRVLGQMADGLAPRITMVKTRHGAVARKNSYPDGCKITFAHKPGTAGNGSRNAPVQETLDAWSGPGLAHG